MNPTQTARGFTLLELLIGISLVGLILALLFAGMNLGIKSWDVGESRIATSSRQAIVLDFIRRTFEQARVVRWKSGDEDQLAFVGEPESVYFAGSISIRGRESGQHLVSIGLADGAGGRDLVMRWQVLDLRTPGFSRLESSQPKVLVEGVSSIRLSYYGAKSDSEESAWHEQWFQLGSLPRLIRLSITMENGETWPDVIAAPQIQAEQM